MKLNKPDNIQNTSNMKDLHQNPTIKMNKMQDPNKLNNIESIKNTSTMNKIHYLLQYTKQAKISSFWLKIGSYTFYQCVVNNDGTNFTVYATAGKGKQRVIRIDNPIQDGIGFVTSQAYKELGGVFWGCGDPSAMTPMKEHQEQSTQLVVEIDDLSYDEQLNKYVDFCCLTGEINPWLIFSGGKSLHMNIILDKPYPMDEVVYLRRLLCIALDGDHMVARHHQPFRVPGFYNNKGEGKGGIQKVENVGSPCSYDAVLATVKEAFKEQGLTFPEKLDDLYWSAISSILNSDKQNGARKAEPVTKEVKLQNLKEFLAKGYNAFIEKNKKETRTRVANAERYKEFRQTQFKSQNDLEDFILELLQEIPTRQPGTGTYSDYRAIFVAVKNELGLERAVDLAHYHSPDSNWKQILESSTGSFSLGTIIHYAKLWGHWQPTQSYKAKNNQIAINARKQVIKDLLDGKLNDADINVGWGYSFSDFQKDLDDYELSEFQKELINTSFINSKGKGIGFKDNVVWKIPDIYPEVLEVTADSPLPDPNDYFDDNGNCKPLKLIILQEAKKDRAKIINNLRAKGWKHIFDKSQTGSGKSYSVAKLDGVIYLDQNYKNPSIEDIKDFPYLPPRNNNGLWEYQGKIYSDPSQKIIDSDNSKQLSEGNCLQTMVFHELQKKGHGVEGTSEPCEKCPENYRCHMIFNDGDKATAPLFKGQRQLALKMIKSQRRGRIHPDQIYPELVKNTFPDFTGTWEEAASICSLIRQHVSLFDLYKTMADLAMVTDIDRATCQALLNALNAISKIGVSEGKALLKKTGVTSNRFFGLNDEFIRTHVLKGQTINISDDDYNKIVKYFEVDLSDIIPDSGLPDLKDLDKEERKMARQFINANKEETAEQLKQKLDQVTSYFFKYFIDALTGRDIDNKVLFKIDEQGEFHLVMNNKNYQNLSKAFKCNIYLNATAHVEQIKGFFAIPDTDSFITIQDETEPLINIGVVKVNSHGIKSNTWSDDAIGCLQLAVERISQQYPDKSSAVICPKKYAGDFKTNYYFGRDDRGSNELKDNDILIFIGTPSLNLGALEEEWILLYKDRGKFSFEEYYRHRTAENRLQGLGRHRAQWKKHFVTQYYFCDESEDLSYFDEFLVRYQEIDISDIDVNCARKGDRTRFAIIDASRALVQEQNKKQVKLERIAEIIGKTKQAVSKAMKAFKGGWKTFKKNLLSLIDIYNEQVDFEPLFQDKIKDWLTNPDEEYLTTVAKRYLNEGVQALVTVAKENNASRTSIIRLFLLLAPLHDVRLQEIAYYRYKRGPIPI